MHAIEQQHKYEFIDGASESKSAMQKFIGRFHNDRELHEYIVDAGIHGLALDSGNGPIHVPFIDMPASYWRAPYRRRRLAP